jgi:hypothetical protein
MTRLLLRHTVTTAMAVAALGIGAGLAIAQRGGGAGAAAQNAPTPRTPDGKVDFSGLWAGGGGGGRGLQPDAKGNITTLSKQRPCHPGQECGYAINFERDSGVRQRMDTNVPMYKPEYWEKVYELDVNGNFEDPSFGCMGDGVPRMGPPTKIVQTPTEMILLYNSGNTFRVVPIDGRPHDPDQSLDQTLMGDPIGRWEGDTLVIESVGFTDQSWLGWAGWFHTIDMRVEERLTRKGNTLTWQATVYDPEVLMQPWTTHPETMNLNTNPKAILRQDLPCDERDQEHMKGITRERG